jgi:dipeptidyl aminopeptidase/acylaminoacyl peptidase
MMPVGGGAPVTLTDEDASLLMPRVSPDGDRIAFLSRVSGAAEIYVMSIRDRRRVRISISGGTNPVWGPGGKELFFQSPQDQLMRVGLNGTVVTDPPKALFRTCESVGRTHAAIDTESSYDVSADGARFLAICEPLESIPSAIHVIVNWQSKIK